MVAEKIVPSPLTSQLEARADDAVLAEQYQKTEAAYMKVNAAAQDIRTEIGTLKEKIDRARAQLDTGLSGVDRDVVQVQLEKDSESLIRKQAELKTIAIRCDELFDTMTAQHDTMAALKIKLRQSLN